MLYAWNDPLYNIYLFVGKMPFEKIFIISVLSQWRCYKYNLVLWIFLICMTFADGIFWSSVLKKCYFFGVIFWPCWTWSFTAVLILHTFMVIVLTGSFRDCVVSHCVQLCSLQSSIFFYFRVAFVVNKGIYLVYLLSSVLLMNVLLFYIIF